MPWGAGGVVWKAWVSTVLTSALPRRCTPWNNRRIPTISAGRFDGGLVDVSAVDTEPLTGPILRGSAPGRRRCRSRRTPSRISPCRSRNRIPSREAPHHRRQHRKNKDCRTRKRHRRLPNLNTYPSPTSRLPRRQRKLTQHPRTTYTAIHRNTPPTPTSRTRRSKPSLTPPPCASHR